MLRMLTTLSTMSLSTLAMVLLLSLAVVACAHLVSAVHDGPETFEGIVDKTTRNILRTVMRAIGCAPVGAVGRIVPAM